MEGRGLIKGECDTDAVCGRVVPPDPDAAGRVRPAGRGESAAQREGAGAAGPAGEAHQSRSVNQSVNQSVSQSGRQSANQSVSQSANHPFN